MSVFNNDAGKHTKQPLFFGDQLGLQRYDEFAYPIFDKLTQKQLGYFWRPEEVALQKDRTDYQKLDEGQKFIFTKNISYQIYSDSVQGRGPALAFLPYVSVPELEACIITWDFFESIHSRSYTHILKNVYADPSEVFNKIVSNKQITERSSNVCFAYDQFMQAAGKSNDMTKVLPLLYLAMMEVNILEGLRFYSSFAVTFAFGEMKLMEGSAKIIKFIARDEAQHYAITQHIFKIWNEDKEMKRVMKAHEGQVRSMFMLAVDQEKEWAKYLFSHGSMIGLNTVLLNQYIEWLANKRLKNIDMDPLYPDAPKSNPLPWTENWLSNQKVQVAPQETEISSYIVGGVKNDIAEDSLKDFKL